MEDTNRVYRIRTVVGDEAPNVIHVPLNQSYDMFEILSLKLDQTNDYKTYKSDYGVIVGRVIANGGFGVPNAKVSIFIESSYTDIMKNGYLYNYANTNDTNEDGVRYNLLPDFVDDACHQDVGTFPNKRLVLDNQDIIEIFDTYWKYTTTTNHAGDYMLYGIPTGSQQLHVDVDLSDCGILSQRPRDMIGKGYNENMFESPNKFKSSTNLNSLAQIVSQDRGIYVYPYWGDVSEGDKTLSITRCDISLEYKFESYAVFIGSIVTDKNANAIGKNCTATGGNGKMSDLIAGEGTIEMIRKTLDNRVEEFPIMGNRLIDGDGVWCYQIPMNLDYVTTDEFGNLVQTDNPDKGIATRTRVRFRISIDENPNDATARKRARYLVPNNPRMGEGDFDETLEADYEFGSSTREESYCDMFWNKVYTVKNYIPKLQKNSKETNRKHTGIKLINHYGDNNPMPYNALTIKLTFTYRIICVIAKIIINLIEFINEIISIIGAILCLIIRILEFPAEIFEEHMCFKVIKRICPFTWLGGLWRTMVSPIVNFIKMVTPNCIGLSSEFCDDGINQVTYYPGCGYYLFSLFPLSVIGLDCVWEETQDNHTENQLQICKNEKKSPEDCEMSLTTPSNKTAMLYNCIENQLAQQNDATSFNFYNDWVNGVLYAPLWHRKITPKKRFFFGLFKRRAKDDWCSSQREYPGLRLLEQCSVGREDDGNYNNFDGEEVDYKRVRNFRCDSGCHKSYIEKKGLNGVIVPKQTMLGQTVYYYKAGEYDASLPKNTLVDSKKNGDVKLLFATDIVLLGSLNDCDLNGIPQFFKTLESTTYNLPSDILFTDYDFIMTVNPETGDAEGMDYTVTDLVKTSEMAGCDWGNPNEFGKYDGGLFYSIGCSSGSIDVDTKSCINLARICEYGVSLDETKEVADLVAIGDNQPSEEEIEVDTTYYQRLITDGFISWDELYNLDERSMFATMNGNRLKTKLNINNGLREYDFRYLYPENFDGSLKEIMEQRTKNYTNDINYKNNYELEEKSRDYYIFRMGNKPYYYEIKDDMAFFPRYENSFYFYFGLKAGKTAIEKFNSKYFAQCVNPDAIESEVGIKTKSNSWCVVNKENVQNDGYLALDFGNISTPYSLLINGVTDSNYSLSLENITEEKIQIIYSEIGQTPEGLLEGYTQVRGTKHGNNIYYFVDDITKPAVEMMDNGNYQAVVTDDDGNITEFMFTIKIDYLSFKLDIQNFIEPNNVLFERFNTANNIAKYKNDANMDYDNTNNVKRTDIGGVVTVHDIFREGESLKNYRIELNAKEGTDLAKSGEYEGVTIIYNNGQITIYKLINSVFYQDDEGGHHYAFGLPKGGTEYTIRVIELCDGVETKDVLTKDFLVDEPLPFKMFINDIDYDVIKYFNGKTGWDVKELKLVEDLNENSNMEGINVSENPWFHIQNIYYNDQLAVGCSNEDIVSFKVIKNPQDSTFQLKAVTNDGAEHDIKTTQSLNKPIFVLKDEFATNKVGQQRISVYYNWVDNYIVDGYDYVNWYDEDNLEEAYDKIDGFINEVNSVLNLRRELVTMMSDTFYMYCEDLPKSFFVRAQTDKLPYTQTIVYHPEKAVESKNYNRLDGKKLIDEDRSRVSDIKIPTITYESSVEFGEGSESNEVCVAKYYIDKKNKAYKKPYFAAVANFGKDTIPKMEDGDEKKALPTTLRNGAYYIDHNNTKLKYLFAFPLIDKILNVEYIAWSSFINIPRYGGDAGYVSMLGLLAGIVSNGNVVNNKFEKQVLNGLDLILSDNIIQSNENTYIERRVINGISVDEEQIKAAIRVLSSVFGLTVPETNSLDDILGFDNYVTSDKLPSTKQYAFLLPSETVFTLQDNRGCGINKLIDGAMRIELSENSVNNCRDSEKILEVVADDDTVYSIFKAEKDGSNYPLNRATQNGAIWHITHTVDGIYSDSTPENMFSYKMKSDYFRGVKPENVDNSLVDTNFVSQTLVKDDNEQEDYEKTYGYGTTGLFELKSVFGMQLKFNYPVFIVGEDKNHVRALSPVYDYSDVSGLLKFGTVEFKKIVEKTQEPDEGDEDEEGGSGGTTYETETITDYKLGIAIKKDTHYYLDHYRYLLSGVCKIDEVNIVEFIEDSFIGTNQYLFATITEVMYETLKSKTANIFSTIQLALDTTITAIDCTGLRHVCCIDANDLVNAETSWCMYTWYANMPTDDNGNQYQPSYENGGIVYGEEYLGSITQTYEKNSEITVMQCSNPHGTGLPYTEFLGWSENEPSRHGPYVEFTDDNLIATKSKVYFANWNTPLPQFVVTYLNYNDDEIDSYTVEEMDTTSPPSDYEDEVWIDLATGVVAGFPYTVTESITFKILRYVVHFKESEDAISDLFTEYVKPGDTVSPILEYADRGWYLYKDNEENNKERVTFPYTVNEQVLTFVLIPSLTVTFFDHLDIQIGSPIECEEGQIINVPDGYSEEVWINKDTQEEVSFPYEVTNTDTDLKFKAKRFTVVFRDSSNTNTLDTQYIIPNHTVTPRGECVGKNWYLEGDPNKTEIDFTIFTVTQNETLICFEEVKKYIVKWYMDE